MRSTGWLLTAWLLGVATVMPGCHARFKKYVDQIDEVRPQVITQAGPSVSLGGAGGDDLASAVVNVVQGVRAMKAADRLASAVRIDGVNSAFAAGVVEALGSGPPFGTSPDQDASLLQVEVVNYGLEAPVMGMAGTFNYDLRVSIYLPGGKKVYSAHHSCNVAFGDASAFSRAFGTVDNVRQLNEMSDDQIQEAFEWGARACGPQLVARMRKHASSSGPPVVASAG
jgi:hypothetical protein